MKLEKIAKKIGKIVGILMLVILIVFLVARYGWRVFGFQACDSPSTVWVENVTFEDDEISIKGGTVDSISSYVGYRYEIKDGNLYLGVKHNLLGGFLNRIGGFHITIQDESNNVQNVYLTNGKEERLIWNVNQGRIK